MLSVAVVSAAARDPLHLMLDADEQVASRTAPGAADSEEVWKPGNGRAEQRHGACGPAVLCERGIPVSLLRTASLTDSKLFRACSSSAELTV